MKKIIIAVLVVAVLALPQLAQAHGPGGGPCILGIFGFLLGLGSGIAVSHPPALVVVAPPPPSTQCFRLVQEHWEMHWDPYRNAYIRELVPEYYVWIPCR